MDTNPPASGQPEDLRVLFDGLFAALFLFVGLLFGLFACYMLAQGIAARSWLKVPAIVLEAELDSTNTHHTDSITRRVLTRYSYKVGARTFVGTQVALVDWKDDSDYAAKCYRLLRSARDEGTPLHCYVNPADPTDSVLDRSFRTEPFLSMSFMCAGFCFVSIASLRAILRRAGDSPSRATPS